MNRKQIRMVAYGGILTALVLVATMYLQIPNGQGGNLNLGDGIIFASALIMGPFAGIVAAIGSLLADLFTYPQYAPATLIIKGLMGLIAGILLKKGKKSYVFSALIFTLCELIMIGGYFGYECFLFGLPVGLASIPANVIQGLAGIGIGLALLPLIRKIFDNKEFNL